MYDINNCIALELLPPAEKADNSLGFEVASTFLLKMEIMPWVIYALTAN